MQIAIYGAGLYGRLFSEALQEMQTPAGCFIDQFSTAESVMGLPVKRLDEIDDKANTRVLVSVALNEQLDAQGQFCGTQIKQDLVAAGYGEVFDFAEAIHQVPTVLSKFPAQNLLWMREDTQAMVNEVELQKLDALLCDQTSRDLLKRIVAFRQNFTAESYVQPDGQEEYFPEDVPILSAMDALRFVDAGAYIGDTAASASEACRRAGKPIDFVASFEPDLQNIEKLSAEVQRQIDLSPQAKYFIYTSGVWSENAILSFSNEGNSSSTITAAGESSEKSISIAVNALDSVLFSARPNYLKMDIEGAESAAIMGAKKLIQTYQPALAICIYHKPADLWELPLLIHELVPDYQMSIRVHGHMGLSTVLYCLPKFGSVTKREQS